MPLSNTCYLSTHSKVKSLFKGNFFIITRWLVLRGLHCIFKSLIFQWASEVASTLSYSTIVEFPIVIQPEDLTICILIILMHWSWWIWLSSSHVSLFFLVQVKELQKQTGVRIKVETKDEHTDNPNPNEAVIVIEESFASGQVSNKRNLI